VKALDQRRGHQYKKVLSITRKGPAEVTHCQPPEESCVNKAQQYMAGKMWAYIFTSTSRKSKHVLIYKYNQIAKYTSFKIK
jgi:hypothetical protein